MRDTFTAQGWLHLPQHTPPALLERLTAGAERMMGSILEHAHHSEATPNVWQVPGARFREPAFADPALDQLAAALGRALLGCERVQLLQDVLLLKPPRCTGQIAWHRDYTYLGFLDPSIVTLRVALTDSSEQMGCMEVIDTSHTWRPRGDDQRIFASELGADALQALTPEQRAQVERLRRPLPMQAGDVTAHHCLTIHGSFENPTDTPRMSLLLRLFDARCRLRADQLPPHAAAHFQTTPDGHLDPNAFPLLDAGAPEGLT